MLQRCSYSDKLDLLGQGWASRESPVTVAKQQLLHFRSAQGRGVTSSLQEASFSGAQSKQWPQLLIQIQSCLGSPQISDNKASCPHLPLDCVIDSSRPAVTPEAIEISEN